MVISGLFKSNKNEDLFETRTFAQLLLEVLLKDVNDSPRQPFTCITIAVDTLAQKSIFERVFEAWLIRNDVKEEAETESEQERGGRTVSEGQRGTGSAGERPALDPNPIKRETSNSKLDSWLNPPPEEQDMPLMIYDPALSGKTWNSCPEAEMVETGLLRQTILKRIVGEIRNIVRWRENWDKDAASEIDLRSRGQKGHCREIAGFGRCDPWDPTQPHAVPRYQDSSRVEIAAFLDAIINWGRIMG